MDKETLITLLKYKKNLLKEQIKSKAKYRKLELEYSKDISLKRKQFLAHSVQDLLRNSMCKIHKEIEYLKYLIRKK
jgi:hypothetical protein